MSKLPVLSPVLLPLSLAQSITERAIQKVQEVGVPYGISVFDASGNLVLSTRMDGAVVAAVDSSLAKGKTAATFGMSTREIGLAAAEGQPLATMQTGMPYPVVFVAGGVPITNVDGTVIGAVGAGGGPPEKDHEVAEFAIALVQGRMAAG